MRTLLLPLPLMLACGTTPPPPDAPPIPTAKAEQMPDLGVAPPPACLTRYRYSELGITFDCPTTFVGGDPHHYVTTCQPPAAANPYYFPPPDRDEIELDAGGRLVHEVQTYATPPAGWHAVDDAVRVYTDDGQLQELTVRDGAGIELFHRQVDSRDAAGRPVTVSLRQIPLEIGGVSFPETGASQGALAYDDGGRLIDEAFHYTSTGHLYYDRSVSYDDAALRRDYALFADLTGVLPGAGHADTTLGYEQLDAADNILETAHLSDPPSYFDYRYDEQGRVVTSVWTEQERSLGRVIQYIYDCP